MECTVYGGSKEVTREADSLKKVGDAFETCGQKWTNAQKTRIFAR